MSNISITDDKINEIKWDLMHTWRAMNIVANRATDMRQMATAMVVVAVIASEAESFLSVVPS